MQLKPEQLGTHLDSSLKPVYLISGEEPLLVQEALDEVRKVARANGYDEREVYQVERGFDWNILFEGANSLSLFGSKKIIELKMPGGKPGTEGAKVLVEFLAQQSEDTLLLIESGKIDKKSITSSKWCKSIDQCGAIVQVWPIKPEEMLGFMRQRSKKMKLNIEYDALQLLSSRLEGNPLAAKQELDKLYLLHGSDIITVGMIFEEVKDSARYDAFDLSRAMLQGHAQQSANILNHLKSEGTEMMVVLWTLTRELRVLAELTLLQQQGKSADGYFRTKRIFPRQQTDYKRAAGRLTAMDVEQALTLLKGVDDTVKGAAKENAWILVEDAILRICGHALPSA